MTKTLETMKDINKGVVNQVVPGIRGCRYSSLKNNNVSIIDYNCYQCNKNPAKCHTYKTPRKSTQ